MAAIDPQMMMCAGIELSDKQLKQKAIANMFGWIPSLTKRKSKPPKVKKLSTKERITKLEEENKWLTEKLWSNLHTLRDHVTSGLFMKELAKGLSIEPDGTVIYKTEAEKIREQYDRRKRKIEEAKASGQPVSFMHGVTICNGGEFGQFGGSREGRSPKRYSSEYYEKQVRELFETPKIESK